MVWMEETKRCSSMFGLINEFLMFHRIVACGYGDNGLLRLSNRVFEFLNL